MYFASVKLLNCILLGGAKRNTLANKLGSTFFDDREDSLIVTHYKIRPIMKFVVIHFFWNP